MKLFDGAECELNNGEKITFTQLPSDPPLFESNNAQVYPGYMWREDGIMFNDPNDPLTVKFIENEPTSVQGTKSPLDASRTYNVGKSDYSQHKIQPWDIWIEYNLDPFEADIIKRVLRNKKGESRREDFQKIRHICEEIDRQYEIGYRTDTI